MKILLTCFRFLITQSLNYLITLVFFSSLVEACPGCKEALFEPGQLTQRLATAKGYAWSIGLLLGMPAALVGSVTLLIVRAQRRKRRS